METGLRARVADVGWAIVAAELAGIGPTVAANPALSGAKVLLGVRPIGVLPLSTSEVVELDFGRGGASVSMGVGCVGATALELIGSVDCSVWQASRNMTNVSIAMGTNFL